VAIQRVKTTIRSLDNLLPVNDDETEDDLHCFRDAGGRG
jgi:hypothetical protein